ncbi:hypothetical protein O7622_15405 [Micromonospora sp. WMMD1076]|nr:hypothetical protein [Micromonospora sp. WMMD1076]WFF09839.1 hypothetical protein O7622_15405 [Micromonospora sp. WMMD1076]
MLHEEDAAPGDQVRTFDAVLEIARRSMRRPGRRAGWSCPACRRASRR